jgi:hypothetical protein
MRARSRNMMTCAGNPVMAGLDVQFGNMTDTCSET